MEYIKKEELKEGEIYKNTGNNIIFKCINDKTSQGIGFRIINKRFVRNNWFSSNPEYLLATSEEKHWLNECIKLDKFITFEEAMKTFIPEYVECIRSATNAFIENKVYKVKNKNYYKTFDLFDTDNVERNVIMNGSLWQFKPSTKESYDAQFVVKEPAENKTELEIWLENTKSLNLSLEDLEQYIESNQTCNFDNIYMKLEGHHSKGRAKILFDKWNEKVIEPLPQFKIIETIETITKVENNEGNQFFIGDLIKSDLGHFCTITGFEYNSDKSDILAITTINVKFNINRIEHYIEPKTDYKILEYKTEGGISCKAPFLADSHQFYINERCKIYSIKRISDDLIITVGDEVLSKTCGVPNKILSIEQINNKIRLYPRNSFYNLEDIIKVKEETLLEKAKRLYPIGTIVKSVSFNDVRTIRTDIFKERNHECSGKIIYADDGGISIYSEQKDKWAEIIK